jgi:hypothetical protein
MTAVPASPQSPNLALLLGLAWLVVVAQLLADHWAETAQTFPDMDDAMRMVEVRGFLDGRGWFDLHEMRLGPPDGYDTHWSRLVDAGIAGQILAFRPFMDAALAERLARTIWPMLWLLPAMAGVAAIAWRLAGSAGAPIAFLFAALGLPAFQHFIPGRIDHHNVQIALAVALVAATAWSDRRHFAATAAGILTGVAMAVGFEGGPYVVLAGAAMALRFICDPSGAGPLRRYGLSAAASVAVAFVISVGPAHWAGTACDAIAINSAAAVVVATLGLALAAAALAPAGWPARAGGVLGCGLVSTVVFLALEPACLAGPFAMMDPMVRSIWFTQVSEMQSLPTVAGTSAPMAAAVASFPAVGVLCALALARDRKLRGDFGFVVATAALLVAVAVMLAMVRAYSYAVWLAIPMAAAAALRLGSALRLATLAGRTLVALMLTPTVTSAVALAAVGAMTRQDTGPENSRVTEGCLRSETYAGLAKLPPGLVATDIDYGPYVLALTPHSVMSAPYHRLVAPIIAAHQIFALPPDAAVAVVVETGVDYLVTCGRHALGGIGAAERAASLWGRLAAGEVPAWLERVETESSPLAVYRVKHQKYDAD